MTLRLSPAKWRVSASSPGSAGVFPHRVQARFATRPFAGSRTWSGLFGRLGVNLTRRVFEAAMRTQVHNTRAQTLEMAILVSVDLSPQWSCTGGQCPIY